MDAQNYAMPMTCHVLVADTGSDEDGWLDFPPLHPNSDYPTIRNWIAGHCKIRLRRTFALLACVGVHVNKVCSWYLICMPPATLKPVF